MHEAPAALRICCVCATGTTRHRRQLWHSSAACTQRAAVQIEKYLVFREGEVWAAVHDELVHEGVRPGMQTTIMGGRHVDNIQRWTRTDRSVARFGLV